MFIAWLARILFQSRCWSMSCCHGRCVTAEQWRNARVRRGMIQLAWRFLMFQKDSALALWYRARTADSRKGTRKTMIVALARKLIIALWRFVTAGEPLEGVVLRPAS